MPEKPKRGFALLDPETRRELSSRGGKAAKNRHQWNSVTGKLAGQKSGSKKRKAQRG